MISSFAVGENPQKIRAHKGIARNRLRWAGPSGILGLSDAQYSEETCFGSVARFGGLSSFLDHYIS